MLRIYDRSLQWVLRHRAATMAFSTAVLVATCFMFVDIPKGFIPDQDTDQLLAITEAGAGHLVRRRWWSIRKTIAEMVREIRTWTRSCRPWAARRRRRWAARTSASLVVHLKPRTERKLLVERCHRGVAAQAGGLPGMNVYLQNPPTDSHRRAGDQEPVPVLDAVAR